MSVRNLKPTKIKNNTINRNDELATYSIPKLLFKLSVPAIIAQLVNALYNIVDRIYIGNIPELGRNLLTSVGLTFAVIMIISAFASLIGAGAAPLMSIKLGQNRKDEATNILSESLSYLLILSIILPPIILIFQDNFLYIFGASTNTFQAAKNYLSIYAIGTPFVMIALGMNFFINAQGFTHLGMRSILIGAVSNIILDPIFIFILKMNERGAALASIISQALSAIYVIYLLSSDRLPLSIKWNVTFKPSFKLILPIVSLGLSPFIMQSTEGILQIVQNNTLQKYGGDMAVGAMVIIVSLTQLFFLPCVGLGSGSQAIISFNYGAQNYKRVIICAKLAAFVSWAWLFVAFVGFLLIPQFFTRLFTQDIALINFTTQPLRIYMIGFFLLGLQLSLQNSFVALGQAKISICLALLRKLILLIPLILILPQITSWSYRAVFIAEPISDLIASLCTTFVFIIYYNKQLKPKLKLNDSKK